MSSAELVVAAMRYRVDCRRSERLRALMSVATPSTWARPPPAGASGTLMVWNQRVIRERASVTGSSMISFARPDLHDLAVVLEEVFDLGRIAVEVGVALADEVLDGRAVELGGRVVGQREAAVPVLGEDKIRVRVDDAARRKSCCARRSVMSIADPMYPAKLPEGVKRGWAVSKIHRYSPSCFRRRYSIWNGWRSGRAANSIWRMRSRSSG